MRIIFLTLSLFLFYSCVSDNSFYYRFGTLYIEWADGKTETYEGEFKDYQNMITIVEANYIKVDTVVTDTAAWYDEVKEGACIYTYLDSVNGKYRYRSKEYIFALPTNLNKAQMKRYWIE